MMELMKEAGLNTLLGMGMTFLVLILLSFIISLFGKILNGAQSRDRSTPAPARKGTDEAAERSAAAEVPAAAAETVPAGDDALMAVIAAAVAAYESESLSPEIAAVIAAAVTAYEGVGSGYVVRKIRKSRRHVA